MRTIILLETLTIGGAELFGLRLANALSEYGEIAVAVMHGDRIEPRLRTAIAPGVRLEALKLPAKGLWWKVESLLRRLGIRASPLRLVQRIWFSALVDRFSPTVVHSHLLKADRLALDVRNRGHFFRHVLTMHGDYAPFIDGSADAQMPDVAAVADSIFRRTDAVVTICREHYQYVAKRWPSELEKVFPIRNGYEPISSGPPASLPPSQFRFGMVSRGVAGKGWSVAVEAFKLLNRPAASLVLVGAGPALEDLKRVPQPPNIVFCGEAPDPLSYIHQFDVGLLPTLFPHESLPTAVIEYLYCGKPVIATDVGEIGEMIQAPDGSRAGSLLSFDGAISAAELSKQMAAMMDNEEERCRMTGVAKAAAVKFDMAKCVAMYLKLYSAVWSYRPLHDLH